MSTLSPTRLSYRQNQAIETWLAGGRKSKADALRKAGYSEAIARVPSKFFDSPAVQQELELRGYRKDGMSSNLPPQGVWTEKPLPAPVFDPLGLTTEQIQELKARLAKVGYVHTVEREKTLPASTPRSGYAFEGEETPKGVAYQNMSSM